MVSPNIVYPPSKLFRIGRIANLLGYSSISPEDYNNLRAGNRFDVLGAGVLYAATTKEGCYAETLARFRPTSTMKLIRPEPDEHLLESAGVPAEWRMRRAIAEFGVDSPLPFLDVEATETHTFLTEVLAKQLISLGFDNLEVPVVRGPNRGLTRAIATWAYDAADDNGKKLYGGIRYLSRFGAYECWAIFEGATITPRGVHAIHRTDPDMVVVARKFGLVVH